MHDITYGDSILKYRDTPWDKRCFDIDTKEILSISCSDSSELKYLIEAFESSIESETLVYFRCDANNVVFKKILTQKQYYVAEVALALKLTKFKKVDFNKIYRNNFELGDKLSECEVKQLQDIAFDSFKYSRFHEDPFIENEKAKQRYFNWVLDLIEQDKEILVYRQNGQILSFMFFDRNSTRVNLILGGSREGYGMMTPYFWSSILTRFQNEGIKSVSVLISAANIVIFNLYIKLGFSVEKTYLDFHKFIEPT